MQKLPSLASDSLPKARKGEIGRCQSPKVIMDAYSPDQISKEELMPDSISAYHGIDTGPEFGRINFEQKKVGNIAMWTDSDMMNFADKCWGELMEWKESK